MSEPLVLTAREGGVAEVALNRPDRLNAITAELIEAMAEAAAAIAADEAVRAVVLRGEGRAFCAGLDKANFAAMVKSGRGSMGDAVMTRSHGDANLFQHAALMWRDLPVPVIAAVHGHCLGGGLQIAAGADMRVAAPDARLSVMEMKWGLIPDMGGMVLFPRLVRADVLRRLIWTAEILDGEAAVRAGLATETAADPLARAREIAREIARKSPSAVRAAKKLANLADHAPRAEVLLAESRLQSELIGGAHQIEAAMAGIEGRAPVFR
jgi:enoyl-CoA hydratase/carnithine racemase